MNFDFTSRFVSAITLRSERGIEFLVVKTPNLNLGDQTEAEQIRGYLSSLVSCSVVLASRQASVEWFLFGDAPLVSVCRRDVLGYARWIEHSLYSYGSGT